VKFKRQTRAVPDVNLTPLIDVVFLLLIFFMVTTTFTDEGKLTITLPEANGEPAPTLPTVVEVLVGSDGRFSVNGKLLTASDAKTLAAAVIDAAEGDTSLPFLITADANTSHQSVVTVMDVAGKTGFKNISITTVYPYK
jgi:biopolymer transport protein ExbD|tara:strand:+ start:137 stop:553 length:417 start_codon:yes stop_codon:yes gene_type:complete